MGARNCNTEKNSSLSKVWFKTVQSPLVILLLSPLLSSNCVAKSPPPPPGDNVKINNKSELFPSSPNLDTNIPSFPYPNKFNFRDSGLQTSHPIKTSSKPWRQECTWIRSGCQGGQSCSQWELSDHMLLRGIQGCLYCYPYDLFRWYL